MRLWERIRETLGEDSWGFVGIHKTLGEHSWGFMRIHRDCIVKVGILTVLTQTILIRYEFSSVTMFVSKQKNNIFDEIR